MPTSCSRTSRWRWFALPWLACFPLLLSSLLLSGCGGLALKTAMHAYQQEPRQCLIDSVPFFAQESDQCGPATLAMLLAWSGERVVPRTIAPEIFTPAQHGSLQSSLITAARRHGRVAYPISGASALLAEISAGHPVIILQNLGFSWLPQWHYAVVVGYDLTRGVMILHSGTTPHQELSLELFEYTWAKSNHWGLLVVSATELPATATVPDYLAAVLGLEQAQQWSAARRGYETALRQWPDNMLTLIGLGNSYYAVGDLAAAEKALRHAAQLYPAEGTLFNNLAQILWQQGKQREALEMATQAVKLGGPLRETYHQTLKEIRSGSPVVK